MPGIRTELLASYVATASRVGAWAVVSALVYRTAGRHEFADVALARSSVTLLSYLSLGLGPVLLKRLTQAFHTADTTSLPDVTSTTDAIGYAPPADPRFSPIASLYAAAWFLALPAGLLLALLVPPAALLATSSTHTLLPILALMSGGMLARVLGDVAGTLLQSRGQLALDSALVSMGEWCWPAMFMLWQVAYRPPGSNAAESAAAAFLLSGLLAMLARLLAARILLPLRREQAQRLTPVALSLLAPAFILVLGHLADFCYAPANQFLLARLSSLRAVADYAPALQIDAALLLLTAAVSTVILPRATAALSRRDTVTARALYLRGTLSTTAVLLAAAVPTALLSKQILHAWLGNDATTTAAQLIPLVLVHTVIGGSSGISRAILLAAGKYRPYSAAALTAGLSNVLLAYTILRFTSLGPKGVVAATILTVTARCAFWMPWYTMRTLRQLANSTTRTIIPPAPLPVSEA